MAEDGLLLSLRISPGASKTRVMGLYGESQYKVAIKSPPVDGKANEALCQFLADTFSLAKKDVLIVSGETSRSKKVFLKGNPTKLRALWDQIISNL